MTKCNQLTPLPFKGLKPFHQVISVLRASTMVLLREYKFTYTNLLASLLTYLQN